MSSTQPVVTVVMLVYNRARYVRYAIESILQQTYPNFELLVIDDASTDDSAAIIRSYKDPRIRLISNSHNLGLSKSRNIGTQHARGRYIAVLDSDDYAYPSRLEKQIHFLESHPAHAAVGSWENWIDESNRIIRSKKKKPVIHDDIKAHLLFRSCMAHSSFTIRTEILKQHNYNDLYTFYEDYDLWVRLVQHYNLANIPEVLISRRKHDKNTSNTRFNADASFNIPRYYMSIIRYQLNILKISHSNSDLQNHLYFSYPRRIENYSAYKDYQEWIESWFLKILFATESTNYCKTYSLIKCIVQHWTKNCTIPGNRNQFLFGRFMRSKITRQFLNFWLQNYIKIGGGRI